jgi:hypothetical protein
MLKVVQFCTCSRGDLFMVRTALLLFAIFATSTSAFAGSVLAPNIVPGSTWVFKVVDSKTGRSTALYGVSVEDGSASGYGMVRRSIFAQDSTYYRLTRNLGQGSPVADGKQGDGNLYDFPLTVNKKWTTRSYWINDARESGYDEITYRVNGEQVLTTSAGKFSTMKVVGVGTWRNVTQNTGGSLNTTLYYAPEAQMTVRSERVVGSPDREEKETKDPLELVFFRLGPQTK